MITRPFSRGIRFIPGLLRPKPEVIDVGWKDPYYAVTKLDDDLVNDRLHPNTGAPNYNITHLLSDLTINQDLNLGAFDLLTTGLTAITAVNTPELYNSAGDLKIQPDVQGDVTFFEDTDIASGVDGKFIKVYRKSADVYGDRYFFFRVNKWGQGEFFTDGDFNIQNADGSGKYIWLHSDSHLYVNLGDAAGSKHFYLRDSNSSVIFDVDSNGLVLVKDKVIFTQTDGDEFIDSLADGYMDYGATIRHRFNNRVYVAGDIFATTYIYAGTDITAVRNLSGGYFFLGHNDSGTAQSGEMFWDDDYAIVNVFSDNVGEKWHWIQVNTTKTFSTEGPTDDVDVTGIRTLFIDASGNHVTIGGFSGGIDGQILHVVIVEWSNNTTIEHDETGAAQKIYLHALADETMTGEPGGWTLVCHGGTDWHDCSHAKHV